MLKFKVGDQILWTNIGLANVQGIIVDIDPTKTYQPYYISLHKYSTGWVSEKTLKLDPTITPIEDLDVIYRG